MIFKEYTSAKAWYDQLKPSKKHPEAKETKVLRMSLIAEMLKDGTIVVCFGWGHRTKERCLSISPDNTLEVYRQGSYYRSRRLYNYLQIYVTQIVDMFLGLNTVTKHGATWMQVRAPEAYAGLGWLPSSAEQDSVRFKRAVDNPFELECLNPVFPKTTRIKRAPLAAAMAPYKGFIAYAEGLCKLRNDEGTLSYEDVPGLLKGLTNAPKMIRGGSYSIERNSSFDVVCQHMLSSDPEDNYAALIALCLDAQRLRDYYADKVTLNSKWVRKTIRDYVVGHNPEKYKEVVTVVTGRIPTSLT